MKSYAEEHKIMKQPHHSLVGITNKLNLLLKETKIREGKNLSKMEILFMGAIDDLKCKVCQIIFSLIIRFPYYR